MTTTHTPSDENLLANPAQNPVEIPMQTDGLPQNFLEDQANLMPEPPPTPAPKIKLTGRMLQFTRLSIQGNDLTKIQEKLEQKFGSNPRSRLPVVIECDSDSHNHNHNHNGSALNLAALLDSLWTLGLQPIGIVTGDMDEQALALRLAIFPADGKRLDSLANKDQNPTNAKSENSLNLKQDNAASNDNTKSVDAKTVDKASDNTHITQKNNSYSTGEPLTSQRDGDLIYPSMLRSGQSVNHVGGNLILTHGINAGAEAITDYSLHVYGKAEGRLVAGATGDETARIFCLQFNPSLVSVAGTFCLRENIPSEFLNQAVQVSYDTQKGLVFTLLNG